MERIVPVDATGAWVDRHAKSEERCVVKGRYEVWCTDKHGHERWREVIDNVVTTVGKNAMLDSALAGSAFTVTGPYVGLISNVSWSAVAAGDTMTSHTGWLEAGSAHLPTYSGTRKTPGWNAASGGSKAFSAAVVFAITSTGPDIVKGAFLVFGSAAVNTLDSTLGTLLSAGLFAAGDKTVSNGDNVNVSYSMTF